VFTIVTYTHQTRSQCVNQRRTRCISNLIIKQEPVVSDLDVFPNTNTALFHTVTENGQVIIELLDSDNEMVLADEYVTLPHTFTWFDVESRWNGWNGRNLVGIFFSGNTLKFDSDWESFPPNSQPFPPDSLGSCKSQSNQIPHGFQPVQPN
jgi:hypothetical protein